MRVTAVRYNYFYERLLALDLFPADFVSRDLEFIIEQVHGRRFGGVGGVWLADMLAQGSSFAYGPPLDSQGKVTRLFASVE